MKQRIHSEFTKKRLSTENQNSDEESIHKRPMKAKMDELKLQTSVKPTEINGQMAWN
jgi:hypothetical protein